MVNINMKKLVGLCAIDVQGGPARNPNTRDVKAVKAYKKTLEICGGT